MTSALLIALCFHVVPGLGDAYFVFMLTHSFLFPWLIISLEVNLVYVFCVVEWYLAITRFC